MNSEFDVQVSYLQVPNNPTLGHLQAIQHRFATPLRRDKAPPRSDEAPLDAHREQEWEYNEGDGAEDWAVGAEDWNKLEEYLEYG